MHHKRLMKLVAAIAATLMVASGVALAATRNGTNDNDVLVGTNKDDLIRGFAGDDDLFGKDGRDTLRADAGIDELYGGNGVDTYYGSDDNDLLSDFIANENNGFCQSSAGRGCSGSDKMYGGNGDDILEGAFSGDTISGDAGDDSIFGDEGADKISGGLGNDTIEPEQGGDYVKAGDGDDSIDAANEETAGSVDTIICGAGTDTVIANNNDEVSSDCENVTREPNATSATDAEAARATTAGGDDDQRAKVEEFKASMSASDATAQQEGTAGH